MVRPKPSEAASAFVSQTGAMRRMRDTVIQDHEGNARSMAELDTVPGTPSYPDKIPNPPCLKCNSDNNPIREARGGYDHAYVRMEEPTDEFAGQGSPII